MTERVIYLGLRADGRPKAVAVDLAAQGIAPAWAERLIRVSGTTRHHEAVQALALAERARAMAPAELEAMDDRRETRDEAGRLRSALRHAVEVPIVKRLPAETKQKHRCPVHGGES